MIYCALLHISIQFSFLRRRVRPKKRKRSIQQQILDHLTHQEAQDQELTSSLVGTIQKMADAVQGAISQNGMLERMQLALAFAKATPEEKQVMQMILGQNNHFGGGFHRADPDDN